MSEYIYVLTNEAMPDLVKIGRTNDLNGRLRELYKTGVPLPFECHYAVVVDDSAAAVDIERKLHLLFAENRINRRREFFRVAPERVVTALSIGNFETYSLSLNELAESNGDIEQGDIEAVEREEKRRDRLKLSNIKIPVGTILTFTRDDTITCSTLEDGKVQYNGRRMSLSAAALEVLQRKYHNKTKSVSGSVYWMCDGETLDERRQRLEREGND